MSPFQGRATAVDRSASATNLGKPLSQLEKGEVKQMLPPLLKARMSVAMPVPEGASAFSRGTYLPQRYPLFSGISICTKRHPALFSRSMMGRASSVRCASAALEKTISHNSDDVFAASLAAHPRSP